MLVLTLTVSAYADNSDDIYVRKDVFDVHLQSINQNLERILAELQAQRNDINELAKTTAVLSSRIDGLDARIDGTNTRIDDLRNGLYLWLVVIGTFISFFTLFIAWPKVKEIIQNKKQFVSRDEIELIVERIVDAKLSQKKANANLN